MNKIGHEFYAIMVQRRDGEVYCDLAKTNQQIYLTKEDAQEDLNKFNPQSPMSLASGSRIKLY